MLELDKCFQFFVSDMIYEFPLINKKKSTREKCSKNNKYK